VHDFTGLALAHTGSASALSVALGAAAAKLVGLQTRFVEEAVREELSELKLDSGRLEKNLDLARACLAEATATVGSLFERPAQLQTAPH